MIKLNRNSEILHEGIVTGVEGDSVSILLTPGASCTGCRAEGSCSVYGNDVKLVKVKGKYFVNQGEKVMVSISESQGFKALLLGYILPLVIMLVFLVLCISLSVGELVSGLVAIGILVPYYLILFIFRRMIGRQFSFKILTGGGE